MGFDLRGNAKPRNETKKRVALSFEQFWSCYFAISQVEISGNHDFQPDLAFQMTRVSWMTTCEILNFLRTVQTFRMLISLQCSCDWFLEILKRDKDRLLLTSKTRKHYRTRDFSTSGKINIQTDYKYLGPNCSTSLMRTCIQVWIKNLSDVFTLQ